MKCDIALEALERELLIDAVPGIIITVGLFLFLAWTIWFIYSEARRLGAFYTKIAIIGYIIVSTALLWQCSGIIQYVLHNTYGSEIQAAKKFEEVCYEKK